MWEDTLRLKVLKKGRGREEGNMFRFRIHYKGYKLVL